MPQVRRSREFFMYAVLRDAAHEKLELLEKSDCHKPYAYMEAMLLSALAIEGFLNHIGIRLVRCWKEIERSLGPQQKLQLILEQINHSPSFGERPYQTLHEMFKVRQILVHGKTHSIRGDVSELQWQHGEFPPEPKFDIETMINDVSARRFVEDMDLMIKDLWDHAGIEEQSFAPGIQGRFEWSTNVELKTMMELDGKS